MLEALLDGKPIRASKELKCKHFVFRCKDKQCEYPELELVAGNFRRPHFRHKRRGNCTCSDGETDWHLEWKSHFEQIEVDMGIDKVTGERNRADAVVGNNFVIEFQHSSIKEDEQLARERFYSSVGGMIWIVDANKVRMQTHFEKGKESHMIPFKDAVFRDGYYYIDSAINVFPRQWYNRSVGVVFDFGTDNLFYLLSGRQSPDGCKVLSEMAVGRFYSKDELIAALKVNPKRFSKAVQTLREEYQWELDRPMRERAERHRLEQLGRQLFAQRKEESVGSAQRAQAGNSIRKAPIIPIIWPYYADAFGRVHRLASNGHNIQLNRSPIDAEYIKWAKQFEAVRVMKKGLQRSSSSLDHK